MKKIDEALEALRVAEGVLDSLYCSESAVATGIEINQESRVTLLDIAFRRVTDARELLEAQEEEPEAPKSTYEGLTKEEIKERIAL